MKLPAAEQALVERGKVVGYLLHLNHRYGSRTAASGRALLHAERRLLARRLPDAVNSRNRPLTGARERPVLGSSIPRITTKHAALRYDGEFNAD
jgi:hypothetical protein